MFVYDINRSFLLRNTLCPRPYHHNGSPDYFRIGAEMVVCFKDVGRTPVNSQLWARDLPNILDVIYGALSACDHYNEM